MDKIEQVKAETQVVCPKPCEELTICTHRIAHKQTSDCLRDCADDDGNKLTGCVPVPSTAKPEILSDEAIKAADEEIMDDPVWNKMIAKEGDDNGFTPSYFYAYHKLLQKQAALTASKYEAEIKELEHDYQSHCKIIGGMADSLTQTRQQTLKEIGEYLGQRFRRYEHNDETGIERIEFTLHKDFVDSLKRGVKP